MVDAMVEGHCLSHYDKRVHIFDRPILLVACPDKRHDVYRRVLFDPPIPLAACREKRHAMYTSGTYIYMSHYNISGTWYIPGMFFDQTTPLAAC